MREPMFIIMIYSDFIELPNFFRQRAWLNLLQRMFFTIKSNVSLTDRGYLNTEIKNLQAMKWCDVINLIYFLPAINDSRKLKNKYN